MRSLICAASVLGLLTAMVLTSRPAGAKDDEKPSTEHIMKKLYKGKKATFAEIKAQLKGESPDWKKVEADAKTMEKYLGFLSKGKAPRGDQAHFEKLASAHLNDATALDHAAGEKDLEQARAAVKKIGGSCKSCHQAHRRSH